MPLTNFNLVFNMFSLYVYTSLHHLHSLYRCDGEMDEGCLVYMYSMHSYVMLIYLLYAVLHVGTCVSSSYPLAGFFTGDLLLNFQ